MSGIPISEKHGVNPGLMICWFCGEASGVALHGRINMNDPEAPRQMIYDMEPCSKCRDVMKEGIMFVEVKSEDCLPLIEADRKRWREACERLEGANRIRFKKLRIPPFIPDPQYRTGRMWGIKETASLVQGITPPELKAEILRCRWTFIAEATARQIGFPHDDDPKPEAPADATGQPPQ